MSEFVFSEGECEKPAFVTHKIDASRRYKWKYTHLLKKKVATNATSKYMYWYGYVRVYNPPLCAKLLFLADAAAAALWMTSQMRKWYTLTKKNGRELKINSTIENRNGFKLGTYSRHLRRCTSKPENAAYVKLYVLASVI